MLDDVTIDAVGVAAPPGSAVTLNNSSVHAYHAIRGDVWGSRSVSVIESAPQIIPATRTRTLAVAFAPPFPAIVSRSPSPCHTAGQRHDRHQPGTRHEIRIVEPPRLRDECEIVAPTDALLCELTWTFTSHIVPAQKAFVGHDSPSLAIARWIEAQATATAMIRGRVGSACRITGDAAEVAGIDLTNTPMAAPPVVHPEDLSCPGCSEPDCSAPPCSSTGPTEALPKFFHSDATPLRRSRQVSRRSRSSPREDRS